MCECEAMQIKAYSINTFIYFNEMDKVLIERMWRPVNDTLKVISCMGMIIYCIILH